MPGKFALLLVAMAMLVSGLSALAQEATDDCDAVPEPRLVVGEMARILPGHVNRVRVLPSVDQLVLLVLNGGNEFLVINGPFCNEGYHWWFGDFGEEVGWIAEGDDEGYWLETLAEIKPQLSLPIPSEVVDVAFEGVGFSLLPEVAHGAEGEIVPEELVGPAWVVGPEHTRFTFEDSAKLEGHRRELRIYPAAEYERITGNSLDELRALLDDPEAEAVGGVAAPERRAKLVYAVQPERLDFENGSGVRYVAHFSQGLVPMLDGEFEYLFAGLTDDGEQFVLMQWVMASDLAPDASFYDEHREIFEFGTPWVDLYMEYIQAVEMMMGQAAPDSFVPSLDALDALIESLSVP